MNELINKKHQQLTEQQQEYATLVKIAEKYPDLKEHTDRWGNKYYTSASANQDVTDYDLRHSCGCCPDSILYLYPYLLIDVVKVYGGPLPFNIGDQEPSYGTARPNPYWIEELTKAKIPEFIISKLQEYFDQQEEKRQRLEKEDID
jgi:hypothetical protein